MSSQQPTRIVVIDDHAMTRVGLAFMIKTFADILLIGEADNGTDGVALCLELNPDVVLVDMLLPDMDGLTVIANLREQRPTMKLVALSSFDDRSLVERAILAGAISYILKNITAFELAQAIRRAHQGRTTLSPEAAQALVEHLQQPEQPSIDFTDRERAVLQHMSLGKSNTQIGELLFISAATVKGHVGTILGKLGVKTRAEAIAQAWASGLVKIEE